MHRSKCDRIEIFMSTAQLRRYIFPRSSPFFLRHGVLMESCSLQSDLYQTFERVVVINLARRSDRLERFLSRLTDWPFLTPQRFEAVDGSTVAPPPEWDKGPGAWGCMLSHQQVLDQAIADGINSLLVLEDDSYPVDHFGPQVLEFLKNVPDDWDGLMLGAEHLSEPKAVLDRVVRCTASNRAHAYAVRGRFMKILSQFWHATTNDHCDVVLCSLMHHFNFYAPNPLLIGQDCGLSDITGRLTRLRFLSQQQKLQIAAHDARCRIETLVAGQRPVHFPGGGDDGGFVPELIALQP
jgi:hypothetical protein